MALAFPRTAADSTTGISRSAGPSGGAAALNTPTTNGGGWGNVGLGLAGDKIRALAGLLTKGSTGSPTSPDGITLVGTRPVGTPPSAMTPNPGWVAQTGLGAALIGAGPGPAAAADSYSSLQTLQDYIRAQLGMTAEGYAATSRDLELQQQALARKTGLGEDWLRTNTGNSLAQLGEDRYRTVDIGQQRVDDQIASGTRDYQNLVEYLTGQRGLAGRSRDSALGYYGEQRGLAGKALDLALRRGDFARDTGMRDAASAATAGGALLSGAMTRPAGDLATQWRFGRDAANNEYSGAISTIDRGVRDTGISYDRANADIDNTYRTGRGRYEDQMTDAQRTRDYLDSMAKTYGLRAEDMRNALDQGLTKLGIDRDEGLARLAAAAASSDAQAQAVAQMLAQQAVAMAGSTGGGPVAAPPPPAPTVRTGGTTHRYS